jgi:hypothetical protein
MPTFKVYQPFESDDVIIGKTSRISSGFFPDGDVYYSQSTFLTSPLQLQTITPGGSVYDILNGLYYTEVYNDSVTNSQLLFSVSYGEVNGSGSVLGSPVLSTKATYSQYRNVLLGSGDIDGLFSFRTGSVGTNVYPTGSAICIMNFSAQLMRDQIDPGQWSVNIGPYSFIDEFPLLTPSERKESRLVYEIISGSFDSLTGQTIAGSSGYDAIGLFYPKSGIMVFNATYLNDIVGVGLILNTPTIDINSFQKNDVVFYNALKNAGGQMRIRKSEFVPSTHYFVRVKNQDFNYSNNITFAHQETDVSGSFNKGDIIDSLIANPITYVTTVGLYNDVNELVAVAKLSKPTMKSFDNELLIRIRLDF